MVGGICCDAVGRLYDEFPRELLEANLEVVDLSAGGKVMLEDAIKMGILYR
jgi:hypothetical protein